MGRVTSPPFRSAIEAAASRLREKVMAIDEGAFLGSEELLQTDLSVSRATVRQAARVLEQEGLLRVRRGINGGYFAARPNAETLEKSVSAYLEMLNVDGGDLLTMASVLWVEVIRKATVVDAPDKAQLIARHRQRLDILPADARYQDVQDMEQAFRTDMFSLIDSRYIELIFQINMHFAHRRFPAMNMKADSDVHRSFVQQWRDARMMELNALSGGDAELGGLAARHMRNIWESHMRTRML